MASTKDLEDTLPLVDTGLDTTKDNLGKHYTVYTLISLHPSKLQELIDDINNAEDSTSSSRLAPDPDFSGQSLRDIYDYHTRIRDEDETIHPCYLIVADQDDWKTNGVLMVYTAVETDASDPAYVVGVGRCGWDWADSCGANLDIANMDWIDFKEVERDEWGGEDPYENKRYFPNSGEGVEEG